MLLAALFFLPGRASAHCDTMDGPVVSAARTALQTNNINRILIWVRPEDEEKIRSLFARILKKRAAGGKEAEEADLELFSELVRIHRAGEGAGFDGLKPAGQVEASVAALDRSLIAGSPEELTALLGGHLTERLEGGVHALVQSSDFDPDDVEAGRAFVAQYVTFAHYVEGIQQAIHGGGEAHDAHHGGEAAQVSGGTEHDLLLAQAHAEGPQAEAALPAGAPAVLWPLLIVSLLVNAAGLVLYFR